MQILLVMHGMPPKDFPADEKREFMRLHAQYEQSTDKQDPKKIRHDELEAKMRSWPRTPENDSFWQASYEIGRELEAISGSKVKVAFNEFCAPSVEVAIDQMVAEGATEISVTTPMVTRGGSHAETEIPELIESARKKYPKIQFTYAWPFDAAFTAKFLAEQIERSASLK